MSFPFQRPLSLIVLLSFLFQTLWPSVAWAEALIHETVSIEEGIKRLHLSLGVSVDDKLEEEAARKDFGQHKARRIKVDFDQGLENLQVAVERSLEVQTLYPGLQVLSHGLTWSAFGMSFLMTYQGNLVVSGAAG
jgi:hypothetical protein